MEIHVILKYDVQKCLPGEDLIVWEMRVDASDGVKIDHSLAGDQ